MSFRINCDPHSAHMVNNIRVFSAGRIQILFQDSSGELPNIRDELHAEMAKGVLEELRGTPVWQKYTRTLKTLAEAKRQHAELNADATVEKLKAKRYGIINEAPSGMAAKLAAVDTNLASISGTSQAMADSIESLNRAAVALRHECTQLAGKLSESHMNAAFDRLAKQEIATAKAISDKCASQVAELARIKSKELQISQYNRAEQWGVSWVDEALASA